jgi:2-polyprenyl-3-methyl-5-hydroxy-6-metoxy-1,4-benzoquinol methylase
MGWDPTTHYQEVQVAEQYDGQRFSSLAGRVFNGLEKGTIRRAFHDVPRHKTVVDVPCGTGRLAETLLEMGFVVTGVDISSAMLDVAKRRLQGYDARFRALCTDVHDLGESRPATYDVALCARVLMHFPLEQQIAFLRSVAKATRETVIFTQSLSSTYHRLRRRVKRVLGHQPSAGYPITNVEIGRMLKACGLREVRRIRLMPPISEAILIVAVKN